MTAAHHNESEVARIRQAIIAEHEAGQHALYSLAAGPARHDFITAKQQRIGEHFHDLAGIVSSEQTAIAIIADTLKDVEVGNHAP
ncbi:hypothetical protein [Reticulibacter mediterranei]|nr:hypothetical protein [Reticulibacter mediterranei]